MLIMTDHAFGGPWTEDKLSRLAAYLRTYGRLFQANERAKKFTRIYVDAFAGSGYRRRRSLPQGADELPLLPELLESDAQAFLKGSARIALEVTPAFHEYIFIERDKNQAKELEVLKGEFAEKAARIKIVPQEANEYLRRWCKEVDWRYYRAIVFLDPYGMEVEWATIEALADTKGVDLWMLFPLGSGVIRLLTKDHPPKDEWADAITRILGTAEWEGAWYTKTGQQSLFGEAETPRREVDWHQVSEFVIRRLKTIFVGVAPNPYILRNSTNVPLYLLCFAASNTKGAVPALRIANYILGRRPWPEAAVLSGHK
jgi:three-Cys-motif partner protein